MSDRGKRRSEPVLLRAKSHWSLGLGTASPRALADWAARNGRPAIALTDLENLYGQVEFQAACAERSVRAISGVELRPGFDGRGAFGDRAGRVVLLARDAAGYANLCRIVTRRRTGPTRGSGRRLGEDPLVSLEGRTEGLFVLTDHASTARRLLEVAGLEPSAVRLLLVRPPLDGGPEAEGLRAAEELELGLVADVDAVMPAQGDLDLHRLLAAIHRNEQVERVGETEAADRVLRSPTELARLFQDRPETLREGARVAAACGLELLSAAREAAAVSPRMAAAAAAELEGRCRAALEAGRAGGRWRGGAYDERLTAELDVIRRMELAPYFVAVAEIVRAAAERRISTSGRGSAAGSLVAHLLGVSEPDPIAHGLFFERFLHVGRVAPPDIDLDVDSSRREELIGWVHRSFGPDRVAMACAHQTFRERSALRDGLAALGVRGRAADRFLRGLPPEELGESPGAAEGSGRPGDRAAPDAFARAASLPGLAAGAPDLLRRLVGKPRHISVHPGGVVIGPGELSAMVPLERAPKGVQVTQYDLRALDALGLPKVDLLGNHCLAELEEARALLPEGGTARAARFRREGPSAIPLDDAATFATLNAADTVGCFQVESPAVRDVLRRAPVREMSDLIAALAVVRPGAASGRAKRTYLRRASGLEAPEAAHPSLRERLAPTYGVLLYEEDVLALLSGAGGLSLAEADRLREAIVEAEGAPEPLAPLAEEFVRSAVRSGTSRQEAESAWQTAVRFAAYSFSKAHAASHALLAVRAAYLKTHFPREFGCALLNHHGGMYPPRTIAAEVARMGVRVLAPDVNRSAVVARPQRGEESTVRLGLRRVKHLRRRSVRTLLETRRAEGPFRGVADLLERVRLSRKEVRALVLCGACDSLPPLDPAGYPFAHQALLQGLEGELSPQGFRRAVRAATAPRPGVDARAVEKHRRLVRVRNELELLDVHPSDHPMRILREDAAAVGCAESLALESLAGSFVRFAGIVAASRRVRTRSGRPMQFLTLEDEHGLVEAVLLPGAYARLGGRITTPGPFLVGGRVVEREGALHLRLSELKPFYERHPDPARPASSVR